MSHWVIQNIRGSYIAYGPYKTPEAAANRYEKTTGGEIRLWESLEDNPEKVIQEVKDDGL